MLGLILGLETEADNRACGSALLQTVESKDLMLTKGIEEFATFTSRVENKGSTCDLSYCNSHPTQDRFHFWDFALRTRATA